MIKQYGKLLLDHVPRGLIDLLQNLCLPDEETQKELMQIAQEQSFENARFSTSKLQLGANAENFINIFVGKPRFVVFFIYQNL